MKQQEEAHQKECDKGNAFVNQLNQQLAQERNARWQEGGQGSDKTPCPSFGSINQIEDNKLGAAEFKAWVYQAEMWYASSSASQAQKVSMMVAALKQPKQTGWRLDLNRART